MSEMNTAMQMRVFSGIQPTGAKHLGNFSGGFRQYHATQERAAAADGAAYFCIVDLHSITVAYDPEELRESTLALAAMLFATGLDPARSTVFVQSHVPTHPEAAWLLASATSFGELRRMTQFKDKSDQQEFVSVGLFTYPVLMAADILLYHTTHVPVGEDQRQHLELARDVAQRFNMRYGELFTIPEPIIPEIGGRIMDLQEPSKKMSTTGGTEQGTVFMLDSPETIRKKFKSAVTDSGREVRRARDKEGVSNLIEIMSIATGEQPEAIESRYDGAGYGQFKDDVAEAVIALLEPVKRRYEELRSDPGELERLLRVGAEKARAESAPTLAQMYERMGFVTLDG
jgi:tryptophanyl-tRNA synthetase